MFIRTLLEYPVLLFADAIFGGQCVTLTSRYHSDGRKNYDISKLFVNLKPIYNITVNDTDVDGDFKRVLPYVFKSNSRSKDAPVLQLQFCYELLADAVAVKMRVQYDNENVKLYYIPRLIRPKVNAAACTMSTLKDLWSARAWLEHHRNIGIQRFNIYVNDHLPRTLHTINKSLYGKDILYLLSQPDVFLIEWPYSFKDPNTTRDVVYDPMHYARPLEWNSCNEREHYGARITLFNDMDEFVITRGVPLLSVVENLPSKCDAIQLGHYWVKVSCPCPGSSKCVHAFDSLEKLRQCKMWRHQELLLDTRRRTKLIVKTEREGIHAILNHDLGPPLHEDCRVKSDKIASFFHVINMRPHSECPIA